jgi:hypothetical protein
MTEADAGMAVPTKMSEAQFEQFVLPRLPKIMAGAAVH